MAIPVSAFFPVLLKPPRLSRANVSSYIILHSASMLKRDIRKSYLKKRQSISVSEAESLNCRISDQFRFFLKSIPSVVHRYLPAMGRNEPDPGPLVDWLLLLNPALRQMAPRIRKGQYNFDSIYLSDSTRWKVNTLGIPEPMDGMLGDPAAADLVFIPLIAFDQSGHRVGYGKGFYDRFLALCKPECIRLGLSWFGPVDAIDDVSEHDIPLQVCITPERVYSF